MISDICKIPQHWSKFLGKEERAKEKRCSNDSSDNSNNDNDGNDGFGVDRNDGTLMGRIMEVIKVLHESNNDGAACDDRNETDRDIGHSNRNYG